MPLEIELKLLLPPGADAALAKAIAFGPSKTLAATYYDTAKAKLAASGIAIRIRREGRRLVQTVKTAGQGIALEQRGEWETTLKTPALDWDALAAIGLDTLAKRVRKRDLNPVFTTAIARRTALVEQGGATIELALDRGLIEAGRRSAAVSELELELKSGPPEALVTLAETLIAAHGLTLGTSSKSARGYDLAAGTAKPKARRAEPLALDPAMTLAEAAQAALGAVAIHALGNLPAIAARLPEGAHQMRVALRRLRAALTLFKTVIPTEQRRPLRDEAGRLARLLGAARDRDVFLAGAFAGALRARGPDPDLALMGRRIRAARKAAWADAAAAAASPRAQIFLLKLAASRVPAAADAAHPSLAEFAAARLDKRLAPVEAHGARLDALTVEERHALRLELKKLRYAVEFLGALFPAKKVRAYTKALTRLQDVFGAFNDAAVAAALAGSASQGAPARMQDGLTRAALFLNGWTAHRADGAWAEAAALWRDFAATRPFWRGKDEG